MFYDFFVSPLSSRDKEHCIYLVDNKFLYFYLDALQDFDPLPVVNNNNKSWKTESDVFVNKNFDHTEHCLFDVWWVAYSQKLLNYWNFFLEIYNIYKDTNVNLSP